MCRFRTFGGSSLDFELMGWIDQPANRGRILHQINNAIYKKFAENGIEIPYAKRDLYIKEMPAQLTKEDAKIITNSSDDKKEEQKPTPSSIITPSNIAGSSPGDI